MVAILSIFSFACVEQDVSKGFTLTVTSDDIAAGGTLAAAFSRDVGCGGTNLSPQLSWSGNIPDSVRSWAVLMFDRSNGDFVHWNLYNIPKDARSISQETDHPGGAGEGPNDFGVTSGYDGPCLNTGESRTYEIHVYGLRTDDLRSLPSLVDPNNVKQVVAHIKDQSAVSGSLPFIFVGP